MTPTVPLSKKVCILGDFAVGKTSLVRRFVYDRFDDKYISTIGVKVSRKTVMVARPSEMIELTLLLWDLAGSEEFNQVRASYMRGAAGALLVADLTRPETIPSLRTYVGHLTQINPGVRMVLAANKHDLVTESAPTLSEAAALAQEMDVPIYLTSAKLGDDVETAFRQLGQLLVP